MPLPPGTEAPDFTLPLTPRSRVSFHALRRSASVLAFYPRDWEPVSREQLALFQDYLVEIERLGASLVGVSVDHFWSHRAFTRDVRLRFPLLSDARPRGATARLYGVYCEEEEQSARALFVIDSAGIIRFSQVYPDDLNPGVNEVLTALEALHERKSHGTDAKDL